MSQGTFSSGSFRNSWTFHSRGLATKPSTRSDHSSAPMLGVGPAVRTGKPDSAYWPGGRRSARSAGVRRRPAKPRETKSATMQERTPAETERVGFEPTRQREPPTRFPVVHLKPLGHLSG